ncbi:MAG: 16S rRNA (cytosine(1402)-N(4))-methyltransferase RsmH [Steroidobacteraceae bacterium]
MDEHSAVLIDQVLDALAITADGFYVDATFGRGGHTARILEALGPDGRVLALDRDPQAIAAGRARFAGESRITLVQSPFADLAAVVSREAPRRAVSGVLLDLGVSSPQFDRPERGFSFRLEGPLDMRMDPSHGKPVSAWLSRAGIDEIRTVIAALGEERFARRIARAIVERRGRLPITTTTDLAAIVAGAVPTREYGKHPATRTFQALRMHVNDELAQLDCGLEAAHAVLARGGRLVVISFHSLEDRRVKEFMRRHATVDPALAALPVVPPEARPTLRLLGRKRRPDAAEIVRNPRARSAVLRAAEKLT